MASDSYLQGPEERKPAKWPEPRLLRAREVAAYLGLAPSTVYALIASGALPSLRIGTSIRVDRKMLDGWIDQMAAVDTPTLPR